MHRKRKHSPANRSHPPCVHRQDHEKRKKNVVRPVYKKWSNKYEKRLSASVLIKDCTC